MLISGMGLVNNQNDEIESINESLNTLNDHHPSVIHSEITTPLKIK